MSDPSRVALIIGIDSYNDESLEDLPACRQDAEDLCQLLTQNLNYKIFEDGPIIGSKLNKENGWIKIREAIGNFFLDAKPRQTLLFYFSGHGIPRDGDVYLGTPQIEYKKPSIKGYSLAELTEKMMTSTLSKQIVCIVDACYSGAAKLDGSKSSGKDTSAVASATYDKVWKHVPKAEGKYLLLSSQSYERSWSTETNSIYTRYLIEGLKGIPFEFDGNGESIPYSGSIDSNGNVTPELLHDYVYYKIASQKFEGEIQIPKIKVDKSSKIILARYPKAVKRTDEIVAEQVHKRKYHAFLSRAHVNKTSADNLHTWLRNAVRDSEGNDHIYYHKPEPGVEKSTILRDLIPQCRSIIMLLSSDSIGEGWIKDEYYTAKNHKDLFSDFKIIPVRIEECKVPEDLKKDLGDSLIELSNGKLDLDTSKEILERMYYRQRTGPGPEQGRDLYISRGWRQEEKSLAENICRLLDKEGFRLIGDAEDQKEYDVSRVKSIISSCGGFVAIVPYRAKEKKLTTSKYILREIDIAQRMKLPSLIITAPKVRLKEKLAEQSIHLQNETAEGNDYKTLQNEIRRIGNDWYSNPHNIHYVFFATDLDDINEKRREAVRDHVQLITSMSCKMAPDYKHRLHEKITKEIADVYLVIADISDNNLNTLIEAGIALGAGTNVRLVARRSTNGEKNPPFMLNDIQIEDYADDKELLQKVHRISYEYRRRILNYELDPKK